MYGRDLRQIHPGDPRPLVPPHILVSSAGMLIEDIILCFVNNELGSECKQMCSYMGIFVSWAPVLLKPVKNHAQIAKYTVDPCS